MQKLKKSLNLAIIISETSHVFCCVLPTIFTVLSLMSGVGIIAVVPAWISDFHAIMHEYEIPMILASGVVLGLGWGPHYYAQSIDCHDTGCHHGPCGPQKKSTSKLLIAATVLFLVNIFVYTVFHRGMESILPVSTEAAAHAGDSHEEHDHPDHGHAH